MHLEALREGAGPDVDLLIDLNFNARTEGYLKIVREIADLDMFWVELDTFSPEALGYIRRQSRHPIASCETLLNLREFLPYFSEQAMDVAIVDVPWNGAWQSMKIAALAEAHEVNVAPHNFYGHLCTMMAAHFCAAVPNFRIMETDLDRLAWDDELVTHPPGVRGRPSRAAGPSRLGHRAQRGGDPRASAEEVSDPPGLTHGPVIPKWRAEMCGASGRPGARACPDGSPASAGMQGVWCRPGGSDALSSPRSSRTGRRRPRP